MLMFYLYGAKGSSLELDDTFYQWALSVRQFQTLKVRQYILDVDLSYYGPPSQLDH